MPIGYNEPVTFRNGTARALNCVGIDFSEDGLQSWTVAPVVELDIQLPFGRQTISLRLEGNPFTLAGAVPVQKVFVFIDGSFIGYANFAGHSVKTFPIGRSVMSGRLMRLTLVIPTATSPADVYASEDMRELGLHLTSVIFIAT
jgi:hypothetical protein